MNVVHFEAECVWSRSECYNFTLPTHLSMRPHISGHNYRGSGTLTKSQLPNLNHSWWIIDGSGLKRNSMVNSKLPAAAEYMRGCELSGIAILVILLIVVGLEDALQ